MVAPRPALLVLSHLGDVCLHVGLHRLRAQRALLRSRVRAWQSRVRLLRKLQPSTAVRHCEPVLQIQKRKWQFFDVLPSCWFYKGKTDSFTFFLICCHLLSLSRYIHPFLLLIIWNCLHLRKSNPAQDGFTITQWFSQVLSRSKSKVRSRNLNFLSCRIFTCYLCVGPAM